MCSMAKLPYRDDALASMAASPWPLNGSMKWFMPPIFVSGSLMQADTQEPSVVAISSSLRVT